MANEHDLGNVSAQRAMLADLAKAPARPLDTMASRRAREKRAHMRLGSDGRANRTAQPYRELNVKVSPDVKDRLNAICRRKGWLIRDFVLECLEEGFKKHGADTP